MAYMLLNIVVAPDKGRECTSPARQNCRMMGSVHLLVWYGSRAELPQDCSICDLEAALGLCAPRRTPVTRTVIPYASPLGAPSSPCKSAVSDAHPTHMMQVPHRNTNEYGHCMWAGSPVYRVQHHLDPVVDTQWLLMAGFPTMTRVASTTC